MSNQRSALPHLGPEATERLSLLNYEDLNEVFGEQAVMRQPLHGSAAKNAPLEALLQLVESRLSRELTARPVSRQNEGESAKLFAPRGAEEIMELEARASFLVSTACKLFPEGVW